jgi:hypothetical protein
MRQYDINIDIIKGITILSVLILHIVPYSLLSKTFSEFHIWQAVPVFIVIITINFEFSVSRCFSYLEFIKKRAFRIIIPMISINILYLFIGHDDILFTFFDLFTLTLFSGPGKYFIFLLLQIVFLFYFISKLHKTHRILIIINSFFISIAFEYLIYYFTMDRSNILIRGSILQYIFLIVLTIELMKINSVNISIFKSKFMWIFYISIFWLLFYKSLGFDFWQNFLGQPYSIILYIILYKILTSIKNINLIRTLFSLAGKASLHIFLLQILLFGLNIKITVYNYMLSIFNIQLMAELFSFILIIFIISFFGVLWYILENRVLRYVKN